MDAANITRLCEWNWELSFPRESRVNEPWSAASSGKRPRAFRIIGHYRHNIEALCGPSAGPRFKKNLNLKNQDKTRMSISWAAAMIRVFRSISFRTAIHLISFQWHSVAWSALLRFGLFGITGFENWNYFGPFTVATWTSLPQTPAT